MTVFRNRGPCRGKIRGRQPWHQIGSDATAVQPGHQFDQRAHDGEGTKGTVRRIDDLPFNRDAAEGKVDASLVALVETHAADFAGWEPLTLALEAAQLLEHRDGPVERAEVIAEDRRGLVEIGEDLRARVDLPGPALGFLSARVAVWHRDHRGDPASAVAALRRSLAAEPGQVERLEMLAALQRVTPDTHLIDTLLALDAQREDNFDELYEACLLYTSPSPRD